VPERWRPFSARLRGDDVDETLYEGVPAHLRGPLEAWLGDSTSDGLRQRVAARVRAKLGPSYAWFEGFDDERLLDAVDFVLHAGIEPPYSNKHARELLAQLRSLLVDAGSAYKIASDNDGLERRVDTTVADTARRAIQSTKGSSASEHLAAAWTATYGLHPHPPVAYAEMIKAVEATAQPVIEPANSRATLGSMLRQLEKAPGRLHLGLAGPTGEADPTVAIAMCRTLWQGQTSRHGSGRPTRHETQAEAEAAIQLTVTLVSWFTTGALRLT
jgi:hypothetical protein